MSTVSRASKAIVAASVGVVEALKDQAGICRWNSPTLRSAHQQAKKHFRSYSQANKSKLSSSSTSALSRVRNEKLKKSEEYLRTVMYLSCWGPNTYFHASTQNQVQDYFGLD